MSSKIKPKDIDTTGATNGQVLTYNSGTAVYEPTNGGSNLQSAYDFGGAGGAVTIAVDGSNPFILDSTVPDVAGSGLFAIARETGLNEVTILKAPDQLVNSANPGTALILIAGTGSSNTIASGSPSTSAGGAVVLAGGNGGTGLIAGSGFAASTGQLGGSLTIATGDGGDGGASDGVDSSAPGGPGGALTVAVGPGGDGGDGSGSEIGSDGGDGGSYYVSTGSGGGGGVGTITVFSGDGGAGGSVTLTAANGGTQGADGGGGQGTGGAGGSVTLRAGDGASLLPNQGAPGNVVLDPGFTFDGDTGQVLSGSVNACNWTHEGDITITGRDNTPTLLSMNYTTAEPSGLSVLDIFRADPDVAPGPTNGVILKGPDQPADISGAAIGDAYGTPLFLFGGAGSDQAAGTSNPGGTAGFVAISPGAPGGGSDASGATNGTAGGPATGVIILTSAGGTGGAADAVGGTAGAGGSGGLIDTTIAGGGQGGAAAAAIPGGNAGIAGKFRVTLQTGGDGGVGTASAASGTGGDGSSVEFIGMDAGDAGADNGGAGADGGTGGAFVVNAGDGGIGRGAGNTGGDGGSITLTAGGAGGATASASAGGYGHIDVATAGGTDGEYVLSIASAGTNNAQTFVHVGDQDPSATVSGVAGSLYVRVDGASSGMYINTSAGTGTTWTAL